MDFYERGVIYNSNGTRADNSVKRKLRVRQKAQFSIISHGGIPYLRGLLGPQKMKEACQTRNRRNSLQYSINALHIVAIWVHGFSRTIAVMFYMENDDFTKLSLELMFKKPRL